MTALGARIVGEGCSARPMTEAHREPLRAACAEDPDVWEIYFRDFGPEGFDRSFDQLMAVASHPFVLYEGEELAGMSSFLGVEQERGVLEIGVTYYRPKFRGTGFNERVKAMMLGRAFAAGFRRVEFKVDARNARSQAAMAKFAVREGVMRADRITWTGHVRDTVLFSVLADEWDGKPGNPL
ncbi:GNAT family N-acetyltransferase [Sphingomicrobium nitratireducens]|uniref:GNAT family N-acetyltransferase n=1 Tax=Sphingomicrobium nitratireducens TaxID=2964666 RepID=UPI0022406539|nr:GNAT family protein [Sphingomicrobium nitratireducens]